MRVLVAPDKFKGSLTAAQVADAIARGLAATGAEARTLPLADGGDGSVAAAVRAGYAERPVDVLGADGRGHRASYASDGETAVVEVASTCGLATLPPDGRRPMDSSSHGFGQAVLAARDTGVRRVVLALGGSASTDGGAGLLSALGARLLDADGREVAPGGGGLARVARVDVDGLADLSGLDLVVAADVTNPLLGADGAAAVFGPQKGADPDQVEALDRALAALVAALPTLDGRDPADLAGEPGAGAAGGLGFACAWLGGRRVAGAGFFLELLDFDGAVAGCDAVVTGEGGLDAQTLQGKLPAVVAQRSAPRPVYAVVGQSQVGAAEQAALGLRGVVALTDLTDRDPRVDPALSAELAEEAGRRIGRELA